MHSHTTENARPRNEWAELKDASKSAPYCPACVGDGWLSGEWDTCPTCFGTGRMITDDLRRIYRCRAAERESRYSAARLDDARAEHARNMDELTAAQEALLEAARLVEAARMSNARCISRTAGAMTPRLTNPPNNF